jgi:hypothetical protein
MLRNGHNPFKIINIGHLSDYRSLRRFLQQLHAERTNLRTTELLNIGNSNYTLSYFSFVIIFLIVRINISNKTKLIVNDFANTEVKHVRKP